MPRLCKHCGGTGIAYSRDEQQYRRSAIRQMLLPQVERRRALGVKITELCAESGLHYDTVYKWEHGINTPDTFAVVMRYAEALNRLEQRYELKPYYVNAEVL